jgi:pyruvate dehydrogenase E1 component
MAPDGIKDAGADLGYLGTADADEIATLEALERKVRWLSAWTIHNANHIRESRDGLKVGGHLASCASVSAIMTSLYFHELTPEDRVAVKPHASPAFHAIQYLMGQQDLQKLKDFRAYGGAQSYPSRTKDGGMVDFSTGSVGLGAALTNFTALTQDYLQLHAMTSKQRDKGRMIALVGDAELDEGNVYEALMDTWKHDVRNVWWIIDYNRQSLDGVVNENLFRIIGRFFRAVGWNVLTLKYGSKQVEAFAKPGGERLKAWINRCPNDVYSALSFQGGAAWRKQITQDTDGETALHDLIDSYDDDGLHEVMTNLGGHDIKALLHTYKSVPNDKPTCIIAYTIKGWGLPLAGHKDNHAGLMNPQQTETLRDQMDIAEGAEWEPFAGLKQDADSLQRFIDAVPFLRRRERVLQADSVPVPETLTYKRAERASTQEAFGKLLHEIAREGGALADRIVTTSPDVAQSTNLGGWINQRGLFSREARADEFKARNVPSAQKWVRSHEGQHIELGIAENDLFLNLAALGLSAKLFGERLLPIGTLYDPFIARGLDALNYACYQDSRFILVATPSGVSLAPEGGAHQSISTPMIGMAQPGLMSFEPSYGDEVAVILRWALSHIQDEEAGCSVYLRLSTRPIDQPDRDMDADLADDIIKGGYWVSPPKRGAKSAIVYVGAVAPQAKEAFERLQADYPDVGLLAITSADRLYNDWQRLERARLDGTDDGAMAHVEDLFETLADDARLVSVIDGHPAAVAWMGAVRGHSVAPLGVETFGLCGDLIDVYRHFGIDADHIEKAAHRLL